MSRPHITCPVIVLVGPTAVGKTSLSLLLAEEFNCEIISMDSMQVYRHMDIGTAKASLEERNRVPHHLIDIRNPDQQYDAAQFVSDALAAISTIGGQGKIPLLTGGTGLYLSSLINGLFTAVTVPDFVRKQIRVKFADQGREASFAELAQVDPVSAERIHPNDTQRLLRGLEIYHATGTPWSEHLQRQQNQQAALFDSIMLIGLTRERDALYERIAERSKIMIESGLLEEISGLVRMGYHSDLASMQSIGYKHGLRFLNNEASMDQMMDELVRDTRRYAKRQLTWFRQYENMLWFHPEHALEIIEKIKSSI